jgi:hypothetical protein
MVATVNLARDLWASGVPAAGGHTEHDVTYVRAVRCTLTMSREWVYRSRLLTVDR